MLFLSGPLLSGPGTGPGSGVTVLRAADENEAGSIAANDPFVVNGLRTFTVHRWRLNEGSIGVRLSLGAATLRLAITRPRTARRRRCTESD